MSFIRLALAAVFAFSGLLAGCGTSTRVTEAWMDPAYHGGPLRSVLVIGLSENGRRRAMFEDTMSAAFAERGLRAVPSRTVLPDLQDLEGDVVLQRLPSLDVDAVLVTRLIGVEEQEHYVPGATYVVPYDYYYRFDHYYRRAYTVVREPGYMARFKVLSLETNLYHAADNRLIWSIASRSVDPRSAESVVGDLRTLIVEDLSAHGLLPR